MTNWSTLIIGDANTMYNYAQGRTYAVDEYIRALGTATAALVPPVINPVLFMTGLTIDKLGGQVNSSFF